MAGEAKLDFKQRSELILARCLDSFARDLGRLMLRPGVSEVHELRIAIRRLQQVLDLCSETRNKKVRRSLRRLMKLCGTLRDCDVARAYYQGKKYRCARAYLSEQRVRAEEELVRFLSRHAREFHLGGKAALPFSELRAQTAIQRLASDFFDLGNQAIAQEFNEKVWHKARVATKRLRYTVELFTSEPASLKPLLELQRLLGRVHDLGNFRRRIKHWEGGSGEKRRIDLAQERLILEVSELWRQTIQPHHAELVAQWLDVLD